VAEGRKFVENIGKTSACHHRWSLDMVSIFGRVGWWEKREERRPRKRRMSSHSFLQIPDDSASIIGMTSLLSIW
jgi:hypothetical protein